MVHRTLTSLLLGSVCLVASAGEPAELSQALELYDQKQYRESAEILERLHQAEPNNAEFAFRLGKIARKQENLEEAIRWFDTATKAAPDNVTYLVELGGAYSLLADKRRSLTLAQRGRAALEKAVALAPGDEAARAALIDYCREAPGIAGGGRRKAYAHAEELRTLNPAAGTRLLVSLYVADQSFGKAIDACQQTLREHPDDYSLLYLLGRTAAVSRLRTDEGIAALNRALELTPAQGFPSHAHAHVRLSQLWRHKAEARTALAHAETALKLEPDNAEAKTAFEELSRLFANRAAPAK